MRYFLSFSYNGLNYHGWQIQKNANSVQEVIEDALSNILRLKVKLTGAGRTDTGVHAKLMVAHFDAQISNELENNLLYLLNKYLSNDIYFFGLKKVIKNAHARFDAISRSYEYHINFTKNPFSQGFTYHFNDSLDVKLMNIASEELKVYSDFQAFSKSNSGVKTYICDINLAEWSILGNGLIFRIKANRFLRNMVRSIVGTLLDVGLKKLTLKEFSDIIESKNRNNAGFSAPAHGLFLTEIEYPNSIFINESIKK